jgi:hypothetical protein
MKKSKKKLINRAIALDKAIASGNSRPISNLMETAKQIEKYLFGKK